MPHDLPLDTPFDADGDRGVDVLAADCRLRAPEDVYASLAPRLREAALVPEALRLSPLSPLPFFVDRTGTDFRSTAGDRCPAAVTLGARRLVGDIGAPYPDNVRWSMKWLALGAEFQRRMSAWLGLDHVTVPEDDLGTLAARFALGLARQHPRRGIALAATTPDRIALPLAAWLRSAGVAVHMVGTTEQGAVTRADWAAVLETRPVALFIAIPNRHGALEALRALRDQLPEPCSLVALVPDLLPLALLPPLADAGVDALVADAASLSSHGGNAAFLATSAELAQAAEGPRVVVASGERGLRGFGGIAGEAPPPTLAWAEATLLLRSCEGAGLRQRAEAARDRWLALVEPLARRGIALVHPALQRVRSGTFHVPDAERRVLTARRAGLFVDAPLATTEKGTGLVTLRCGPSTDRLAIEQLALHLSGGVAAEEPRAR